MRDIAHYAATDFDFAKLHEAIGVDYLKNELRKMEHERSRWMSAMTESNDLAAQIDKLIGSNSTAVKFAQ